MSPENLNPDADVVELTRRLVAIPSVNPELESGGAGESEIAHWCLHWLRRLGFQTEIHLPAPGRASVVGRWTGGSGPTLILNGHLDTVGVEGMTIPPFEPRVEGGRLYGRGSCDMKGGVAAILAAARAVAENPDGVQGTLLVVLTADEEHASMGVDDLLGSGVTGDAAIVAEPTGLAIMPAHKGFLWTTLRVRGRAAHGSRPEVGRDAIRGAGHFLAELDRYEEELRAGAPHPLLGHGSIHAGTIRGGVSPSVYPEECELVLESRLLPGEEPGATLERLKRVADAARECSPEVEFTLEEGLFRSGSDLPEGHPLCTLLGEVLEEEGVPVWVEGMTAWVEASAFQGAGIPALCFGPGSIEMAHTVDEFVPVDELESAAKVLEGVVRRFLRGAG